MRGLRRHGGPAVTLLVAVLVAGTGCSGGGSHATKAPRSSSTTAPSTTTSTTTTTTLPTPDSSGPLTLVKTIRGDISPKSVVASGRGLVFAQNMMYQHTVTVYDRDGNLVKTIPDTVRLADFGFPDKPLPVRGAPVEAAFSPDGTKAYVSNYSMYGPYFGPEGNDNCPGQNRYDPSFVYRVDVATLAIDAAIPVGKVPKYVATTPDGRFVLVSNWCSYDVSVVDTASAREVRRIPLGPYPRGLAVSPDSRIAYVAVMGTHDIARIDLTTFAVSWIRGVGAGPRHLVLSPDGTVLYVTLNGEGRVAKVDPASGRVLAKVATGRAPRSMAIAADGQSLYVVNYESGNVAKLAAADLRVLQTVPTGFHPIGITYERTTGAVWVANYTGSIMVFASA